MASRSFFAVIVAILSGFGTLSEAGIMASITSSRGGSANPIAVGESTNFTVSLNGFEPGRLLFWGAAVDLPEFLGRPENVQSDHSRLPGLPFLSSLFTPTPVGPPPVGPTPASSASGGPSTGGFKPSSSLAALTNRFTEIFVGAGNTAPPSFSFTTKAIGVGTSDVKVTAFAVHVPQGPGTGGGPQFTSGFGDSVSLTTFQPTAGSGGPPLQAAHAPEPAGFAIFAVFSAGMVLQRRRARSA